MALAGEPLDSRFELVVVEGGGQGNRYYLDRTRHSLGRQDPDDEPSPGVVTFPDPTVSRVHALLEWDPKKRAYLLTHRSRTNATVLNGTQIVQPEFLKAGDKIKMGRLICEMRQADPSTRPPEAQISEPVDTELHLLVLSGKDAGHLHPLNYNRFVLGAGDEAGPTLHVVVPEAGEAEMVLAWKEGAFHAAECKGSVRVLDLLPGIARQRVPSPEVDTVLTPGTALVLEEACLLLVETAQAGDLVVELKEGRQCHPVQQGLDPSSERLWDGGEFHVLRLLSNPLKGTVLWLRPEKLEKPVAVDRVDSESEAVVRVPDREAPRVEIEFTSKGRVLLRNADEKLKAYHNWDEVTPSEEVYLVSGDRFRLGRTVLRYEDIRLQPQIEKLAVRHGDEEMPLSRAVNTIGYTTTVDLRIDDRRLSPTHGQIEVRPDKVVYKHRHAAAPATVDGHEVPNNEEVEIKPGSRIVLLPEIAIELVERSDDQSLVEPMLIGPTQEQIEAARGGAG